MHNKITILQAVKHPVQGPLVRPVLEEIAHASFTLVKVPTDNDIDRVPYRTGHGMCNPDPLAVNLMVLASIRKTDVSKRISY